MGARMSDCAHRGTCPGPILAERDLPARRSDRPQLSVKRVRSDFRIAGGTIMLLEFIVLNREEIVVRTRTKVRGRAWPPISGLEIEHGVPLFLTQLADTLRLETS